MNEDQTVRSGLGLETGFDYLIGVYNKKDVIFHCKLELGIPRNSKI